MLIVDANVLLYAVNSASRQHESARGWLVSALGAGEAVGFAWLVVLAFLRLSTHPSVFPRPLSSDQAVAAIEAWVGAPPALVVEPTGRHLALLGGLLESGEAGSNLVNDAHLAAIALEHGATVVSFDRDFERFEGLRCVRPPALDR